MFIVFSDDAGKDWQDATPYLSDPPNDWGDSPAPTVADLVCRQLHADIHNIDTFYALCEWQDPVTANWRGWLLKTTDRFKTSTWQSLASLLTDGDGNVYPNRFVSFTRSLGLGSQSIGATGALLGPADDVGAVYTNLSGNSSSYYTIVDLGALLDTAGGAVTISVHHKNLLICVGAQSHYGFHSRRNLHSSPNGAGWNPESINWANNNPAWNWGPTATVDPAHLPIRYLRLEAESPYPCGSGGIGEMGRVDAIKVTGLDVAQPAVRPLAMDLDSENGTRLYVTVWNGVDETIELWVYDADLVRQRSYSLGAATAAQITTRELFAVPRTPSLPGVASFGDRVYVFGRMAGPAHLYYSNDAGVSFADVGDGAWSTERIGALGVDADGLTLYAFLNNTPALWKTADNGGSWSNLGANPFGVEYEGVSRKNGVFLAANADPTAGERAAFLPSPYTGDWIGASGIPGLELPKAADGAGGLVSIIWV